MKRKRVRRRWPWWAWPVAVVLLVTVGRSMVGALVNAAVRQVTVAPGGLLVGITATAQVSRREVLLVAPVGGVATALVPAGQLVAAGTPLLRIGQSGGPGIDAGLLTAQSARLAAARQDLAAAQAGLGQALDQLAVDGSAADPAAMSRDWRRAGRLAASAAAAQTAATTALDRIGQLEAVGAAGEPHSVTAPGAGYVYYETGGVSGWTPVAQPQDPAAARWATSFVSGRTVQAGQILGRVVDPTGLRLWLATTPAPSLAVGQQVKVAFPTLAGSTLAGTVQQVSEPDLAGRVTVEVATVGVLPGLLVTNSVPVKLDLARVTGVVVPAVAIARRAGRTGVWILDPSGPRFQTVTVLVQAGGQVVVTGLSGGEEVATTPWLAQVAALIH